MKVAVTCTHLQRDIERYRSLLSAAGHDVVLPEIPGQELRGDALVQAMEGIEGVIAGDDHFSRDVLERLPDLRAISKWGIGLDGVDLEAAADLDITVTNTPGMFGDEVAEQALGYLIALVRGIVHVDREVRSGGWPKPVGRSLGSLRAGIIGLGNIGQSLATKLLALGLTVQVADPSPASAEWAAEQGITLDAPATIAAETDVLFVTCPLNDATHGLVDRELIQTLPPGSWLVNVGRGPVVVGAAVADALDSNHLAGAALDVFEVEPLEDERLRSHPRCILGSHNASNTEEACQRTHVRAIENLISALA